MGTVDEMGEGKGIEGRKEEKRKKRKECGASCTQGEVKKGRKRKNEEVY